MPRHREDDWDDEDGDLPEGVYHDADDGGPPTVPCPYCREPVYESAQFCPRCESYISREDARGDRKPLWIWVCLILALLAAGMMAF